MKEHFSFYFERVKEADAGISSDIYWKIRQLYTGYQVRRFAPRALEVLADGKERTSDDIEHIIIEQNRGNHSFESYLVTRSISNLQERELVRRFSSVNRLNKPAATLYTITDVGLEKIHKIYAKR